MSQNLALPINEAIVNGELDEALDLLAQITTSEESLA